MPVSVVFINCRSVPFLDRIMSLDKLYETRTRDMLRSVVGRRVLLAETGTGKSPVCRCSAVIGPPVVVRSRDAWERLRSACCIPPGSAYDWTSDTKVKYLYPLRNVTACRLFTPPKGVRHGRTYMDCNI